MTDRFAAAPWPASLKLTSASATALLLVLTVFAFRAVPHGSGFTSAFGVVVASALPLLLLGCLLLVVRGFVIEDRELLVRRLCWSTRVPLAGLARARHNPAACTRSIRLFGNGGLFSLTGMFQNRTLGRYRLFATDPSRAVVLVFDDHTVVVTPESPEDFLRALRVAAPNAEIATSGAGP